MKIKNLILTLIYALITLFLVLHHEIWADEAQVWQLCKYLSLPELFKHLVNEGHPSLFYLITMPFAKLNLPVLSMQIICWLSMVVSVFLFLEFSPFKGFTKFSIITSAGFLYFFPIIARNYSIIPLLVFLAAILYKKQKEHPVLYAISLALLANTHVIMFAFVFCLGCLFVYEHFIMNKMFMNKYIYSSLTIFSGLLAVVIQLCGTIGSNGSISLGSSNVIIDTIRAVMTFFLNSVDLVVKNAFEMPNFSVSSTIMAIIIFIMFLILNASLFFFNKKIGMISLLSIGFQFFIYIFSYRAMLYPTRIFCAYVILIFCWWIIFDDQNFKDKNNFMSFKSINIMIFIFFITTFIYGLKISALELFNNYSSGKETAEFIQKTINPKDIIIPTSDAFSLSIIMNCPDYEFYSLYKFKPIKYMIWESPESYSIEDFHYLVTKYEELHKNQNIYILADSFLQIYIFENNPNLKNNYELIFKSPPAIASGEAFRVYKFKKE